jgi:hypothetical protein
MKGKTKPSTRYNRFRQAIIDKFPENSISNFVVFLKTKEDISREIALCCDENDMLLDDKVTMPHALWQIFRLLDKPVLLRDLEVFGASTYHNFHLSSVRNSFYTAISLLYSINLIDYTFRDFNGRPSDTIQFFIKEDELTTNNLEE